MMNLTLYKREMKGSIKLLLILGAVITVYVSFLISMYDPEAMAMLDRFYEYMPEVMSALGMNSGATSLIGYMISYLYGLILILFPMIFSIVRGNGLIAKYVDKGSMFALLAAPVKRTKIAITQLAVLISGILLLVAYSTGLELILAEALFPGELVISELLRLNAGLLFLQLFIGGICFLASCVFSDTKYSIAVGAGVSVLMYVFQMLGNMGGKAEVFQYFTFFSLFDGYGIVAGEGGAIMGMFALLIGSIVLYAISIVVFSKKDLHI